LGQLYQQLGYKDSAVTAYQSVIDMNRKTDLSFRHMLKAEYLIIKTVISILSKTFDKLIKTKKNRPYKDLIFIKWPFYDQKTIQKKRFFYNLSLKQIQKIPI
jgi:hypothetical protein